MLTYQILKNFNVMSDEKSLKDKGFLEYQIKNTMTGSMNKLEILIKLNILEKENRRKRLEDQPKQQEYWDTIEELFDPLTKTMAH